MSNHHAVRGQSHRFSLNLRWVGRGKNIGVKLTPLSCKFLRSEKFRRAKSLVAEKGIMSPSNKKAGKNLPDATVTSVKDFYMNDE